MCNGIVIRLPPYDVHVEERLRAMCVLGPRDADFYGQTGVRAHALAALFKSTGAAAMLHFGASEEGMLLHFFSALTYCNNLPTRSNWALAMRYVDRLGRVRTLARSTFYAKTVPVVMWLELNAHEVSPAPAPALCFVHHATLTPCALALALAPVSALASASALALASAPALAPAPVPTRKLEPDARDDPHNHGVGECEVYVKALVDTFPFVMHDRTPGHYAPKYKKAVIKFQIDVTFLGRIARLSRWYEGSVHDGTIYEDNYDGEPVVGDKAYIGKPRCVTANRGQVSPAQELRNQVLALPSCPLFSSRV